MSGPAYRKVTRTYFAPLFAAFFAVMLAGSFAAFAAAPLDPAPRAQAPSVLAALRQGGYVIYFRHTATDFSQNDDRMTGFEDCERQRNLTDAGRADARAIGGAIRSLGIPIGEVLASPFCRTRETADLIFGRATVSVAVRGGPAADGGRYDELRALLTQPVTGKVNLVISSHGNPFTAVAGTPYLQEGEAAIVEPLGNSAFRVVTRIKKDEWTALK